MTTRGRSVLALGLVVYLAAWAFGSKPLYPVATGLLVVSALAWLWVHVANGPFAVHRRTRERDILEGDDVPVRIELEPLRSVPPATLELVERIDRLGERRHVLRRFGRSLRLDYVLPHLSRGRYVFDEVRAELSDPFGLQRLVVLLPRPGALLVYPRLVPLERLFSESGGHAVSGRRLLLRRPAGFEVHSVREYTQGESLRNVHWRSTARRGQLMVKELEDTLRDEVAVVLDASAQEVAGESFDVQVRAAGSILDAHVRRRRRVALVINAARRESQQIHAPAADWRRALELLAAVQPDGRAPLATLLADGAGVASRALELTVVTARVDQPLVDRLVQAALSRRRVSLVYVDAPTFAGARPGREPALLRLQAAGIPVSVVCAGDDLRSRLEARVAAEVAHG